MAEDSPAQSTLKGLRTGSLARPGEEVPFLSRPSSLKPVKGTNLGIQPLIPYKAPATYKWRVCHPNLGQKHVLGVCLLLAPSPTKLTSLIQLPADPCGPASQGFASDGALFWVHIAPSMLRYLKMLQGFSQGELRVLWFTQNLAGYPEGPDTKLLRT